MVAAHRLGRDSKLLESLREDYLKLLWSTISDISQQYHVVKALCFDLFLAASNESPPSGRNFSNPRNHDANCPTEFAPSPYAKLITRWKHSPGIRTA
jgi:hypothetical protein